MLHAYPIGRNCFYLESHWTLGNPLPNGTTLPHHYTLSNPSRASIIVSYDDLPRHPFATHLYLSLSYYSLASSPTHAYNFFSFFFHANYMRPSNNRLGPISRAKLAPRDRSASVDVSLSSALCLCLQFRLCVRISAMRA